MGHPIKLHNKTSNKCVAAYIRIRYILYCVCAWVYACVCVRACVSAYYVCIYFLVFRFYTIVYTYVFLVHACTVVC